MRVKPHELDRVVLEAVSEDYQSFESVVSKLSSPDRDIVPISEIEHSLLRSIANNLVVAYMIHADPPYATAVGANLDNVRRYWFWITDEGIEYLHRLREKQTISRRRRGK